MSNSCSTKINNSSLQVLKTLLVILQGNFSMSEIVEKLNAEEKDVIFNNSIVSKYINTCRYCGIEIHKIQNKYFLSKIPFGLSLSNIEKELLEELQEVSKNCLTKKLIETFNQFLCILNKFSNKEIVRVDRKTIIIVKEIFSKAIVEKRKINLMLLNGGEYTCKPIDIDEKDGEIIFHVMVNNKEKYFHEKSISGIEGLDEKFVSEICPKEVLFKISGGLAKRYTARENETVSYLNENELLITNYCEDKEALFERLMRYDSCCTIIRPAEYKEDFKKLIDDTLSIYEVN